MSERIIIELPWPHRDLSPNARVHRMALARAKKKAKADAMNCCLVAKAKPIAADAITARVTFFPPANRARDMDNMIASMKAAFDGVSEAIGIDDSKWSLQLAPIGEVVKHGRVQVELEWQP